MIEYRFISTSICFTRYLLVLERKTRSRQLHLAKRFGPKRGFFSCKNKRTKQIEHFVNMLLWCVHIVSLAHLDGQARLFSTRCRVRARTHFKGAA